MRAGYRGRWGVSIRRALGCGRIPEPGAPPAAFTAVCPMFFFPVLLSAPALADAAATYAASCVTCHGAKGLGDGVVAANLPVKPRSFADPAFWAERDDARIRKAIQGGGPAVGKDVTMPAYPQLSAAELDALVLWLKAFKQP